MKGTIRFLGIDPGLRNTGWGVIEACDNIISHVADGRIVSKDKAPMADRLLQIFDGLEWVINTYKPEEVAVSYTHLTLPTKA